MPAAAHVLDQLLNERRSVRGSGPSRLLFGIAFGCEDTAHPAEAARTVRTPVEAPPRFHG